MGWVKYVYYESWIGAFKEKYNDQMLFSITIPGNILGN